MFTAITSNFHWSDPNTLATLHDRPWTVIRMAKTARKQGLCDVSLMLLSKTTEERAMNVSDAFLKLREQILAYYNRESELERHGGLNLINTTNLSFFDASQKSEIFRLKAMFLASLGGRSKANQAYCHSVQISATHARAWACWGKLCASLGAVAETQADNGEGTVEGDEASASDAKANAAKKVSQYLAQAMGCYLEAINIESHEQARIHIPKCLWMLSKDTSAQGILSQTLEDRGALIPAWVWLPWTPQLLTCFNRPEGRAIQTIFSQLVRAYPQAVYYPLRSFYLERRDVERARNQPSQTASGQHMASVSIAEAMMSLLRRSHASLWSSLESVLEELIVKFRPSYEEELLSTIITLLERAATQVGSVEKADDEESVITPVWKTLGRIAGKFFRAAETSPANSDMRTSRTAEFKAAYKKDFEDDFDVQSEGNSSGKPTFGLEELLEKLTRWKDKLEQHVLWTPESISLAHASHALAMFGLGDAPDLWPGSCDPNYSALKKERELSVERDDVVTQSSTSSSAAAARKADSLAAKSVAAAAACEGMGGEYGGGSSRIEVPGQYAPNTCAWADTRPSPELHPKIVKFAPFVEVRRRGDQLVRHIGMIASDGVTYRFLLQFAIPYWTRNDERTAQTHYVLGNMIRRDFKSMRAHLSVQPQPVIPVAQRLRLTLEPDGWNSLEDVHRKSCMLRGSDHSASSRLHAEEMKKLLDDVKNLDIETDTDRVNAEKAGRLSLFKRMASSNGSEPYLLSEYIRSTLRDPELVFHFRRMFSQQWGANCLLQYVFSVTERTPARVAFVETDGRVLAPDFRLAYSAQGLLENHHIPFRLSPNLVNLIGFTFLDACFVTTIARIAAAVDAGKSDLDPILRLLMRDDLMTYYTKSVAKSDSQTQDMEKHISDRVSRNVNTLQSRFTHCSPNCTPTSAGEPDKKATSTPTPIDQNVRELIATARNPEYVSMMPSAYQGWI
jgi:transformation/transcription domain-associated protein